MILFSAEAIFASSTSKFGIRIPLTEHEVFVEDGAVDMTVLNETCSSAVA